MRSWGLQASQPFVVVVHHPTYEERIQPADTTATLLRDDVVVVVVALLLLVLVAGPDEVDVGRNVFIVTIFFVRLVLFRTRRRGECRRWIDAIDC